MDDSDVIQPQSLSLIMFNCVLGSMPTSVVHYQLELNIFRNPIIRCSHGFCHLQHFPFHPLRVTSAVLVIPITSLSQER